MYTAFAMAAGAHVGWAILGAAAIGTIAGIGASYLYDNNVLGIKDGLDWLGGNIDEGINWLGEQANGVIENIGDGINWVGDKFNDSLNAIGGFAGTVWDTINPFDGSW